MNRYLILALLAPVLILTACSGGSIDDLRGASAETITYRGEDLACLRIGVGKTASMTCDFDSFYEARPDLLLDRSTDEEGTYWISNEGSPLACVKKGAGETTRIACDWARFYVSQAPR